MMDGDSLYPKGFHPWRQDMDASGARPAKHLRRSDVGQVKYYFIDFGHSTQFSDSSESHLVLGIDGQDPGVPELSETVPYDPFPVDIRILGDLFEHSLLLVRQTIPCTRML